jgi:WD40 repeat protein
LSPAGVVALFSARFSPDGSKIVAAHGSSPDFSIQEDNHIFNATVFDVQSGEKLLTFTSLDDELYTAWDAIFSPDGTRIVTVGSSIRVWDANSGEMLGDFAEAAAGYQVAGFSPDGVSLIVGSYDGTAQVWDVASETMMFAVNDAGAVQDVGFSPDGTRIVTAGSGLRLWDAVTGDLLGILEGHAQNVITATFSPDGTRLLSGSFDGTARVWIIDPNELVLILEQRLVQVGLSAE